ncbi:hypothetical protein FIU86_12140 [Roseovarius sp. THAF9]|nr:hypothetical protein FIU86_12140 [Roseovarius sp. THAF9]
MVKGAAQIRDMANGSRIFDCAPDQARPAARAISAEHAAVILGSMLTSDTTAQYPAENTCVYVAKIGSDSANYGSELV